MARPQQTILNSFVDAETIIGDGSIGNPIRVSPSGAAAGGGSQIQVPPPNGAADQTIIETAAANAAAQGKGLAFSPGTYVLSEAVQLTLSNALISSGGDTVIRYPSDDTGLAANDRNGFNLVACEGLTFQGLRFEGGTNPELSTANVGRAIHAAADCRDITLIRCHNENGFALWAHDAIADDTDCLIFACSSRNARGVNSPGTGTLVIGGLYEQTGDQDMCGQGDRFVFAAGVVTLHDAHAAFTPDLVDSYIKTQGSTTPGNDGLWKITAVISARELTYANAGGATEAFPGMWWIPRGDTGVTVGGGVGAIALAGVTVTLTLADAVADASWLNRSVRLADATSNGNNGHFLVTGVPAPNQITFDNAAAVAENFAGPITVDSRDNVLYGGNTYGSTHAWYCFGGRRNIRFLGVGFRNIRTYGVKCSGSSAPLENIAVDCCSFDECGGGHQWGADDSQEHNNITQHACTFINCGTGRPGWSEAVAVQVLGSRGSVITDPTFSLTRNSVAAQNGIGAVAGIYAIQGIRYIDGVSQPLSDFIVERPKCIADPFRTRPSALMAGCVQASDVGIVNFWGEGTATLTGPDVNNLMTLADPTAKFSSQLVGQLISFVFAPDAANNIKNAVIRETTTTTLKFENAAGVGGGVSAGTYRIWMQQQGGLCRVIGAQNDGATNGYTVTLFDCVAPEVSGTHWNQGNGVHWRGCVGARIVGCREVAAETSNARLICDAGNSFPFVDDNITTNPALGSGNDVAPVTTYRGMGIATTPAGAKVNYPLMGKRGRCVATGGHAQLLCAYGAKHVNGDTISVNGTPLTFKRVAPGALQFNDWASFLALCTAIGGMDAIDYGAQFAPAVDTQHALIFGTATTAVADAYYIDTAHVLNPTALVFPRNATGGGEAIQYSRGELNGIAADKTVVWSMLAGLEAGGMLTPDDATARALIAAGSYRPITDASNDGCCQTFEHDTELTGTAQFRWFIP